MAWFKIGKKWVTNDNQNPVYIQTGLKNINIEAGKFFKRLS